MEELLEIVAKIFCGDIENMFIYKKGYELVDFFNNYFDYEDEYDSGFNTRWKYTNERLIDLYSKNKLDDFFSLILSKLYIMKYNHVNEVEAIKLQKEYFDDFNSLFSNYGYSLKKINNKYKLLKNDDDLKYITSGGFCDIYEELSTGYIVKKLKEEYWNDENILHRFRREYELTKSLQKYSFIIKVFGFNKTNNSYTMEKANYTLEDFIKEKSYDNNKKLTLVQRIIHKFVILHNDNIIHRDISPNNIFIINNKIVIADFGLGKDFNAEYSHMTRLTNSFGQYDYCAPEQRERLSNATKKSDVYSLGKLINFIFNGKPNAQNHILRHIVIVATEINPEKRYDDADILEQEISNAINEYNSNNYIEKCETYMNNGIYNQNVCNYLLNLSNLKIFGYIKNNNSKVNRVLIEFMKFNEEHVKFVLDSIEEGLEFTTLKWNDYDNIVEFIVKVIRENFDYCYKKFCCEKLAYIAFATNNFKAQNLIAELLAEGLEPSLEKVLEN